MLLSRNGRVNEIRNWHDGKGGWVLSSVAIVVIVIVIVTVIVIVNEM